MRSQSQRRGSWKVARRVRSTRIPLDGADALRKDSPVWNTIDSSCPDLIDDISVWICRGHPPRGNRRREGGGSWKVAGRVGSTRIPLDGADALRKDSAVWNTIDSSCPDLIDDISVWICRGHPRRANGVHEGVDGRVKPGHDGKQTNLCRI